MSNNPDILWFCQSSANSSLSRITDSVLPLLTKDFNVSLLSNKSNLTGIKNIIMGSDTKSVTYKEFMECQSTVNEETIRSLNMKYIMVQIVDLIYENDFKYLMICNGIYEIDWFTKVLLSSPKFLINKNGKRTKLVVWAPIDYIPTIKVIEGVVQADLFLTMTPIMTDEIKKLTNLETNINHVGHGSDISLNNETLSRSFVIKELNKMRSQKLIFCKKLIEETDIIILNANNYGPLNKNETSVINTPGTRKRLDITVKAFLKILPTNPRLKLWIHTNLKSFFDMMSIEEISLQTFADNIILSNNIFDNNQLGLIYRAGQISLQTSYAEGWSLTNLEASMYRSLQVVPDFLACGYHFKNGRGILIPTTRKTIKNEGGHDVIIGEVSIDDTAEKLLEAIELLDNPKSLEIVLDAAYNYSSDHTWVKVAEKLTNLLNA